MDEISVRMVIYFFRSMPTVSTECVNLEWRSWDMVSEVWANYLSWSFRTFTSCPFHCKIWHVKIKYFLILAPPPRPPPQQKCIKRGEGRTLRLYKNLIFYLPKRKEENILFLLYTLQIINDILLRLKKYHNISKRRIFLFSLFMNNLTAYSG